MSLAIAITSASSRNGMTGERHTSDYVESGDKRAELVIESAREFARPEYGVDLSKLETPLPAASLPPLDGSAASRAASAEFEAIGEIFASAGIPWILLSGAPRPNSSTGS